MAGVHLAGAKGRLLPFSVPFRYFGAAVVYHLLAWLALLAGADTFPSFAGGLGWPLAALHLVTLGVLTMTAIGASLQLLPVATRQPIRWQRGPAAVWWLHTPGVALVALGMGMPQPALLASGAAMVALALAIYAALLARNLIGARGMPVVVAHGWVAWVSLVVVIITALSLACAYVGVGGLGRNAALALHVAFAAYGFMGLLALGLSYIVVPMFALSRTPDARTALTSCALVVAALALAAGAAFDVAPRALRIAALAAAALAVGLHLQLMQVALRSGMRRDLGRSFTLVRGAWVLLVASLAAGLALALDADVRGLPTLFGLALVVGWLLTFLLGVLQRIVPFLAAMHAAGGAGRGALPSALTEERPLTLHCYCHFAALALLALSVVAGSAALAAFGAATGAIGAAAFAAFLAITRRRLVRAMATASRALPAS